MWSIAKNAVDEFTLTKMNLLGGDFTEALLQIIPVENLEKKFGGQLPNIEKDFFPPDVK